MYAEDYEPPPQWQLDPDMPPPAPPRPLYADVATFLAGGIPDPPRPVCLRREDGHALFYAGKVNVLFGDPESGKSWIAYAAAAQALTEGRRATILDCDHNGLREVVSRLVALGAPTDALAEPDMFRFYEPEDGDELIRAVHECRDQFRPAVAVVDSIGEILPMLGYSSNSPDDYTSAHRRTMSALASAGACVIAIDHMPKSEDARSHGQTGTMAKKRAVNGASIRVTVRDQFAPGHGGASSLVIHKDRPGGLRATCPVDGKYQPAGIFTMSPRPDGTLNWQVTAPKTGEGDSGVSNDDLAELMSLDPPPKSKRDVQERLGWGGTRAWKALNRYREITP